MAYIDDAFAVLPLGCSCQTSKQINACAGVIAKALGARTHKKFSTYFDWLIAPSISVERLVLDDLPVPKKAGDINWERGKPEFAGYGSLFYHEFLVAGSHTPTDEGFESLRAKFTHTRASLKDAAENRNPIFVWSNTQNNLSIADRECDGLDMVLNEEVARRIIFSGDTLARSEASYIFVTYPDRMVGFNHPRATVHILEKDASAWTGDTEQWSNVFRKMADQSWNPTPAP